MMPVGSTVFVSDMSSVLVIYRDCPRARPRCHMDVMRDVMSSFRVLLLFEIVLEPCGQRALRPAVMACRGEACVMPADM